MPCTGPSTFRALRPLVALLVVACAGIERTQAPDASAVVHLEISSARAMSLDVGDTLRLNVALRDANNEPLSSRGRTVVWSVSPDSIATINSSGELVGLRRGDGTVEARVGLAVGTSRFSVQPQIAWLFLYGPSMLRVGDSSQAMVELRTADSLLIDPATRIIRWSMPPSGVATVDSTGMIRALSVGSSRLRVQVDGRADSLDFTVEAVPPTPPPPPVDTMILSYPYTLRVLTAPYMLPGDTATASVGVYAPPVGFRFSDTLAAFTVGPALTATLSGARRVVALAAGTATVNAWYRGLTGSNQIQILAPPPTWAEFLSVSISFTRTCGVLKGDGSLLCWGGGIPYGSPYGTPRQRVDSIPGSAGFVWNTSAMCGLMADSTLRCMSSVTTASGTSTVKWRKFAQRQINYSYSTCGLLADSTAACWFGSDSVVPQAGTMRFIDLGVGNGFCGIRTDSTAVCWERGSATQTPVGGLSRLVQVASGSAHSCFIDADRVLSCIGSNSAGQLGDGTTVPRESAVRPMGTSPVRAVFAEGGTQSCALDLDGGVWCWGGAGSSGGSTPKLVPTSSGFTSVSLGLTHACGVKADYSAWCWGSNMWGQLGDGTELFRFRPSRVRGSYPPPLPSPF